MGKRKRTTKEAVVASQPSQKRSKTSNSHAKTRTKPATTTATTLTKPKALDKSPFTDNPTGDERKREAALYEQLGSEDENARLAAADAIVSGLLGGGDDCVPGGVLVRHLDKRLFRGLASGRNASRLGFSLVLTEVLSQVFGEDGLEKTKYTGLTVEKVLAILVEKTQIGGNVGGQEIKDHYFGQVFGLECFVRSGILFVENGRWEPVFDLLLKLAQKKVWLRSQCGYIIAQAVPQMPQDVAENTLQRLVDEDYAKTPEGVGIWIAALDRFPKMRVPSKPWRNPLAPSSLSSLPVVLKDSGREESGEDDAQTQARKQKQGNWTAQLHFVWDLILAHFTRAGSATNAEAADKFNQFWSRVVDESFFSKNASDNQKFSGFMIFHKMLDGGSAFPSIVKSLFSKNLMACLMNQASNETRYLHRAAVKALKQIEGVVEKEPFLLPVVLSQLLQGHGTYNFDQRTNSKTVDHILQHTTATNVKAVLKILEKPLRDDGPSSEYIPILGSYLFRLSTIPVGSSKAEDDKDLSDVPGTALQSLTSLAYSMPSVPENIKENLRGKLSSAFAKFVKRLEDFHFLCSAILSIEPDFGSGEAEDDEAKALLLPAFERLQELAEPGENEVEAAKGPRQALALLYAVAILQFYNQDPDAADLLGELEECYTKLMATKPGKETGVSEFLTEILLAMVARPSALTRQVSLQVFEAFTHLMSQEAVQLLTDPLAAEESAKGQQALFNTEDDEMNGLADDMSDVDMEELGSDVEIVDVEEAGLEVLGDADAGDNDANNDDDKDDESSDAGDEDSEAGEEEEDGEEVDNDLEALDRALEEVLKTHRLDKDKDADSEDESDMTDSEMAQFDEKLVEIFRHRSKAANKKREDKDAKESVINFKHRVLDLLAIFVRREAPNANPRVFEVVLPLLRLIRSTGIKALSNKACDVVLSFSKNLKKKSRTGGGGQAGSAVEEVMTTDALLALLEDIHAEAQDASHAFAKALSAVNLAISSALCTTPENTQKVFQLHSQTQLRWYRGEAKIQSSFFVNWVNWCQSAAKGSGDKEVEEKEVEEA